MKNYIITFIKGFILGGAIILPGFSGSICALLLNCYSPLLESINNIKKDIKGSLKFLLPFALGVFLSLILLFIPLIYLLNNYSFLTILFFIGLLCGGIKSLLHSTNKTNVFFYIFGFCFVLLFYFIPKNNNVDLSFKNEIDFIFYLLFVAIISSFCILSPGISLSFVLILIGFYSSFITSINEIFYDFNNINNYILTFVILGISFIIFIFLFSKFFSFLLKKYKDNMNMFFIGAATNNIFFLFIVENEILKITNDNMELLCYTFIGGLILFALGFFLINKIESSYQKKVGDKNEIR